MPPEATPDPRDDPVRFGQWVASPAPTGLRCSPAPVPAKAPRRRYGGGGPARGGREGPGSGSGQRRPVLERSSSAGWDSSNDTFSYSLGRKSARDPKAELRSTGPAADNCRRLM